MILSWSFTEVIRYILYAFNLLGLEPYPLLWTRYTTFWLLYPTGASSEAFLIFATLPSLQEKPLASWGLHEWFRLAMFGIWWPCENLWYLYAETYANCLYHSVVRLVHLYDQAAPKGTRRGWEEDQDSVGSDAI